MNSDNGRSELFQDTVAQIKKTSREISTQAGQKAAEAKEEARRHLEEQKSEVVKQISGLNEALRQTAQSVENPYLGDRIQALAEKVEHAADSLEHAELEDVVRAAEEYSREQPAIFLTGCFLLGLTAARFLRASTPESHWNDRVIPPQRALVQPEVTHGHLIGR